MSNIKDGVYGYVSGAVSKIWDNDGRRAVVIDVFDKIKEDVDHVTAWNVSDEVTEGDRVKFKGWLSFRMKTDNLGRTHLNISMNKPVMIEKEQAGASGPEQNGFMPVGNENLPF